MRYLAARRLQRRLATGAALVVLVAGGCAQQGDAPVAGTSGEIGEFAATNDYLSSVAGATDGLTYRVSAAVTMHISADGEQLEVDGTILTGEVDGERSATTLDVREVFRDMNAQLPAGEAMPGELLEADLSIQMVTDGSTLYMRAPFFASLREFAVASGASDGDLGPLGDLAALGDEWCSIDLSRLSMAEITSAASSQQVDPAIYLDVIERTTDVRELGTDSIGGDEVRGLGAVVTYRDVLEAEGNDPDEVAGKISAGLGGGDEIDGIVAGMLATEVPVEVWVDGDDRVRRVTIELDMASVMAGVAQRTGQDAQELGVSMRTTMSFDDYGDESIEVEIPEATTDVTDEYRALIDGGGVDTGAGGSPFGST